MSRISVVFPAPLRPTSAWISPGSTVKFRPRTPAPPGNWRRTCRNSARGGTRPPGVRVPSRTVGPIVESIADQASRHSFGNDTAGGSPTDLMKSGSRLRGTFGPSWTLLGGNARLMTTSRTGAGAPPRSTGATATIVGIVLLAFGLLCAGGAGAVLISATVARGIEQLQAEDGFLAAGSLALSTDGYALSSPAGDPLELHGDTRALPFDIATFRVTITSAGQPVFVGIAPQRDIDRYLEGVAHSEVEGRYTSSSPDYRQVPGDAPSVPPGSWTSGCPLLPGRRPKSCSGR